MYKWIWDRLPGGLVVKSVSAFAISLGLVFLLFTFLFPFLDVSFFAPPTIG